MSLHPISSIRSERFLSLLAGMHDHELAQARPIGFLSWEIRKNIRAIGCCS
jgi:hypothetical protein